MLHANFLLILLKVRKDTFINIFEKLFKTKGSLELVSGGPTVACSEAINWDNSFKNSNDPSVE